MTPPIPYCAEKDEVLTCSSDTVSKIAGLAFWLCERVVDAPSARILLYGMLPLTATSWPGLEEPCEESGFPAAPGSRIMKFSQLTPEPPATCGSCSIDFASKVVLCSAVSVFRSGTSALTVTCSVLTPTVRAASSVINPTSTVTGP